MNVSQKVTKAGRKLKTSPPRRVPPSRPIRREDRTFLPIALEIIETPSAPLATTMMLIICAFFVTAIVWSYFGRIDVIAVAQGKVQPIGRIKTIQSAITGRVVELAVDNGTKVHAGDILFRLDSRAATAERDAAFSELANFEAEAIRRREAISRSREDLEIPASPIDFPATIAQSTRDNKSRALEADIAALRSNTNKLRAEIAQKTAEKNRLTAMIDAQKALIDILRQRVDMRQSMATASIGSKASVIDANETLAVQEATLAQETGQIAEIDENLHVIEGQIQSGLKAFVAENASKLDEAERQATVSRQRLARQASELDQTIVRSPIDGEVQSSTLTTIGQVVSPGEEVMRIVPDDAGLEIEAYLPNKDIGFVKSGQSAILKIESFPFTRYGTIEATVTRVAKDAIPEPDANINEQDPTRPRLEGRRSGADRLQNLVFPVTLTPSKLTLDVDGTTVPIRAGMAVTVEVKTGQRRLIDYVLSPIEQIHSEAMRER